jgi:hypothetical protein
MQQHPYCSATVLLLVQSALHLSQIALCLRAVAAHLMITWCPGDLSSILLVEHVAECPLGMMPLTDRTAAFLNRMLLLPKAVGFLGVTSRAWLHFAGHCCVKPAMGWFGEVQFDDQHSDMSQVRSTDLSGVQALHRVLSAAARRRKLGCVALRW